MRPHGQCSWLAAGPALGHCWCTSASPIHGYVCMGLVCLPAYVCAGPAGTSGRGWLIFLQLLELAAKVTRACEVGQAAVLPSFGAGTTAQSL